MNHFTIWGKNINYPGYIFSIDGHCISLKRSIPKKLKPRIKSNGYIQWVLNGKDVLSHRVVGQTFIKNEENKPEINYIDGNKKNNRISNIEWVTKSENLLHSINFLNRNYSHRRGENSNFSKITKNEVLKIRQMAKSKKTHKEISENFGISRPCVTMIINNKVWKHIK